MKDGEKSEGRLIHVITGSGRGKTTSAAGLAFRACGHGWRVLMIQFMKNDTHEGILQSARLVPGFSVVQFGRPVFIKKNQATEQDIQLAGEGFEMAREAMAESSCDMLILDEINSAVEYGLIPLETLVEFIQNRNKKIELILTGRNAHPEIIKLADYVSEIININHPYSKGIPGRQGVEF